MSGESLRKTEFPVFNGYAPQEGGPKAVPIALDFSTLAEIDFDLIQETATGLIQFVQSIWVDNSDNPNPLYFIFSQTGQRLKVPGYAQGIWPVIAPLGLRCRAITVPGRDMSISCILLNVPMPMTQYGPITATGAFTLPVGVYTKYSAAITGADQIVIAANANRKGIIISAPSINVNSIFVALDGNAATANFNCYEIMPGGNLPPYPGLTLANIHVIGTAGDNITAYELA